MNKSLAECVDTNIVVFAKESQMIKSVQTQDQKQKLETMLGI